MAFLKSIDQATLVKQVLGKRSEVATTMYAKGMIPDGADKQAISLRRGCAEDLRRCVAPERQQDLVIGYANGNVNAQSMANIVVANLQTDGLTATAQGYDTSTVFGWINDPPAVRTRSSTATTAPTAATRTCGVTSSGTPPVASTTSVCESRTSTPAERGGVTGDTATYVKAGDLYSADRVLPEPVLQQGLGGGAEVAHRGGRRARTSAPTS